MQSQPNTLPGILESAWSALAAAVADRKSGYRLGALATVCPVRGITARTLVLRGVEPAQRALFFHTDARSPKLVALAAEPRASWLGYDPAQQVQLRLAGRVTIHTADALADTHWKATPNMGRRCYLAPHAPSAASPEPTANLPEQVAHRDPTAAESEAGRRNFAVLRFACAELDWLWLSSQGHRRAVFTWPEPGAPAAHWACP